MDTPLKTCFKCGHEKSRTEFYRHPQMADGLLGKCKVCTKRDTANREAKLLSDPATRELEYTRHRLKSRKYRSDGRAQKQPNPLKRAAMARHIAKHPVATKARQAVARAVRSGKLVRTPCEVCGDPKSQAHHEDHTKPLDVRWLCAKHHSEADNALRAKKRTLPRYMVRFLTQTQPANTPTTP